MSTVQLCLVLVGALVCQTVVIVALVLMIRSALMKRINTFDKFTAKFASLEARFAALARRVEDVLERAGQPHE